MCSEKASKVLKSYTMYELVAKKVMFGLKKIVSNGTCQLLLIPGDQLRGRRFGLRLLPKK